MYKKEKEREMGDIKKDIIWVMGRGMRSRKSMKMRQSCEKERISVSVTESERG